MASYIGTLKSPTGSKSGVLKSYCDVCQEAAGYSYCPECLQIYCKICAKAHSNISATKEHNLISWDDPRTLVQQLLEKGKQIKELEAENANNRDACDKIKVEAATEVEMLRTEMKQNGDELMKVKAILAEKERTTKELQEINKAKEQEIHTITIKMQECQINYRTEITQKSDDLIKVKDLLEEKQRAVMELHELHEAKGHEIQALTAEINQNKREMEHQSRRAETLLAQKEIVIAGLEKDKAEYERKVKTLTEEVKSTKTQMECVEGDVKKTKALLAEKENIIEQLQDENLANKQEDKAPTPDEKYEEQMKAFQKHYQALQEAEETQRRDPQKEARDEWRKYWLK